MPKDIIWCKSLNTLKEIEHGDINPLSHNPTLYFDFQLINKGLDGLVIGPKTNKFY